MKKIIYRIFIFVGIILLSSCTDLNLVPKDSAASANWNKNEGQIRWSLNELYDQKSWIIDDESWTDNWVNRITVAPIPAGSVTSSFDTGAWGLLYKTITRANRVINSIKEGKVTLTKNQSNEFLAEAMFARASAYSYLITHFGDVPYYEGELTIDESFKAKRENKDLVLQKIYNDFDFAAVNLLKEYPNGKKRYATQGAALALKARVAINMHDYKTAVKAAHDCMDLGIYKLHPNYAEYFLSDTRNSSETIFSIPRNADLGVILGAEYPQKAMLSRTRGGWGTYVPSWSLLASYECTDGLPIDKSPLFDPRNPFKNRDPRLSMTIVPFGSLKDGDNLKPESGSNWLEREYNSHPDAKLVKNYATGKNVSNKDTRSVTQYASFTGLLWKKGIDSKWLSFLADPDIKIIRYAEILLIYAEAKIELNQIDNSVLNAINQVRARAYGVNVTDITNYPAITTKDQAALRLKIRNERRVEFADEGMRYMDLIRWKLAEKALTGNIYGLLSVNTSAKGKATGDLVDKVTSKGFWFWGLAPDIDDVTGLPNFDKLYSAGLCKVIAVKNFDKTRQYLWPIPASERKVDGNLTQNPNY